MTAETVETVTEVICTSCKRGPLITQSQARAGEPGIRKGSHGRCKACDGRERYQAKKPDAPRLKLRIINAETPLQQAQHEYNLRSLGNFISRRRARGVSPEGTPCMPSSSPSPLVSASTPLLLGATPKWQIRRLPLFTERAWFAFRIGHHVLWGATQQEVLGRIREHLRCDCAHD